MYNRFVSTNYFCHFIWALASFSNSKGLTGCAQTENKDDIILSQQLPFIILISRMV